MFSAAELIAWIESYYWPFLRVSALFLASPIFSASAFPVRSRIVLAVVVTALIAPSLPEFPTVDFFGPQGLLLAGQQVLVGLAMGFTMQMVFASVVIAGQTLAMTMGLGFAMSVDPQNGVQVPVLSQLYMILSTLIFLAINGHLQLIRFLTDSFSLMPVGLSGWRDDFSLDVVLWASQMFMSGLLLALPALTTVLLINIVFGVITRSAPQLNIFAVGFPVTIFAGFVFILLTMPSVVSGLVDLFDKGLAQTVKILH